MAKKSIKKPTFTIDSSFEKKFYKTKVGKISLVLEVIGMVLILFCFIVDPILGWCGVTVDSGLSFFSDTALYTGLTLCLMYLSIYFTARNYDGPRK